MENISLVSSCSCSQAENIWWFAFSCHEGVSSECIISAINTIIRLAIYLLIDLLCSLTFK